MRRLDDNVTRPDSNNLISKNAGQEVVWRLEIKRILSLNAIGIWRNLPNVFAVHEYAARKLPAAKDLDKAVPESQLVAGSGLVLRGTVLGVRAIIYL